MFIKNSKEITEKKSVKKLINKNIKVKNKTNHWNNNFFFFLTEFFNE